ncbi:MAG: hypothetical protein GC189_11860 [Alphaproteobacteria bacterium]|nr:hypothetical protein [Alphaproteobacteria bacterium]
MPFPASRVGLELQSSARTLTTREILAYAAGLDATEPSFLDDVQAGGLRALPFQCVSLEWPVLVSSREGMSASLSQEEAIRGVHAIQDSEFHRPLRPGDELRTHGRLVLARATRAGVFTTFKLTTVDARSGEPVITSWSSSIYRGVALDGADAVIDEPPSPPLGTGSALPENATRRTIQISKGAPHVYTECADIWNPIHTERAVALAAGLPDIILHGTATWALAGLEILRAYADSDVARLKRISGRFVGMVIPGETIEVRHAQAGGVIRFEARNGAGALAIDQGFAVLSE